MKYQAWRFDRETFFTNASEFNPVIGYYSWIPRPVIVYKYILVLVKRHMCEGEKVGKKGGGGVYVFMCDV